MSHQRHFHSRACLSNPMNPSVHQNLGAQGYVKIRIPKRSKTDRGFSSFSDRSLSPFAAVPGD
uniref:Uncharacterized protein n=2 Tax=Anguilla anguilla TaxID=7936 RepID=A0A0E9VLC8_ANGAN